MTIAALFVDAKGVYSSMPGVDCWGKDRDARKYPGPHAVVAHPPCHLWGNLARVNFKRYGGEHNRPGNDGGCFQSAVASVRCWGGVLEHPAKSWAWSLHGLPCPKQGGWNTTLVPGEYVCEVFQAAYGCKARKKTWLFYKSEIRPIELRWDCPPVTHQISHNSRGNNKPTLSGRAASATPKAFAEILVRLAWRAKHAVDHDTNWHAGTYDPK